MDFVRINVGEKALMRPSCPGKLLCFENNETGQYWTFVPEYGTIDTRLIALCVLLFQPYKKSTEQSGDIKVIVSPGAVMPWASQSLMVLLFLADE